MIALYDVAEASPYKMATQWHDQVTTLVIDFSSSFNRTMKRVQVLSEDEWQAAVHKAC